MENWIISIVQNLAASLIIWGGSKLIALAKKSNAARQSDPSKADKPIKSIFFWAAIDIFMMWFLIFQVRLNADSELPLTGWRVVLIAFWVWWALLYLVKILRFDLGPRNV